MKKSLTILCLSLTVVSFAQFDKVLQDPINDHPSFAGNSGKKRLTAFYAFEKRRNSQVMSYDFFSKRLKGAWGVRAANHRFYFNNEASIKVVYAPKFTSLKKEVTWSPAIGVEYSNFYKDRYEEIKTFGYYGSDYTFKDSRTNNFNFCASISRNSEKSLFLVSANYDEAFNSLVSEVQFVYKLDKHKTNKLSSTFSFSNKYILNKFNFFFEGAYIYLKYKQITQDYTIEDIEGVSIIQIENTQNRILSSYSIKYKSLCVQFESDLSIYKKYNDYKIDQKIIYTPVEKYSQYFINNFGLTTCYEFEHLNVFSKLNYGYINKDFFPSDAIISEKINYQKLTFGAIYNF